uniref:FAM50A/XAP5 C-terminal domain-containing protein n=1 Tax=Tetradesmus obliquus TaxID=3088 RepID=A0A383WCJ7_TETOB|eukprot:jgi/Sobl393_1/15/SZX74754.1
MFANGYVGTTEDSQRIRKLDKQREQQRKKFEELQEKKKQEAAGLRQFGSSRSEAYEAAFKNETVGLVTREEFLEKRNTIQDRLAEDELRERREAEAAAAAEKERRKKEKEKKKAKSKLSFAADEEEEEEPQVAAAAAAKRPAAAASTNGDEAPSTSAAAAAEPAADAAAAAAAAEPAAEAAGAPAPKRPRFGKLGKDPGVQTAFLPDKDREEQEKELKRRLQEEWVQQQEAIKNETLEIVYSYWDGSGHRRKVTVRKGDSIGVFLKAVREQLAPQFRELRAVSVDNMMYIKEDLILPHHHTFYELIVNKARGKSGPLFDFGVKDDIRLLGDASMESQDVHAGKIVERHWYERNKHIFPASRWEIFDPEADYGEKYTIKG